MAKKKRGSKLRKKRVVRPKRDVEADYKEEMLDWVNTAPLCSYCAKALPAVWAYGNWEDDIYFAKWMCYRCSLDIATKNIMFRRKEVERRIIKQLRDQWKKLPEPVRFSPLPYMNGDPWPNLKNVDMRPLFNSWIEAEEEKEKATVRARRLKALEKAREARRNMTKAEKNERAEKRKVKKRKWRISQSKRFVDAAPAPIDASDLDDIVIV